MKKFKQFLNEKWFTSVNNPNYKGRTEEIFVNPSFDEVKDLGVLRWIALEATKSIYVCDSALMHHDLAYAVYQKTGVKKSLRICGTGYSTKGKVYFDWFEEDALYHVEENEDWYYIGPEIYNYDWSFMDKWIPGFNANLLHQKRAVLANAEEWDKRENDEN